MRKEVQQLLSLSKSRMSICSRDVCTYIYDWQWGERVYLQCKKTKRIVVVKMQLFIIVLLFISFALALIGITTNYWYQSLSNEFNEGLWFICYRQSIISYSSLNTNICRKQPYFKSQVLAVFGIVLLSITLILSIIRRYRTNDRRLAYLIILILTATTLLLIFSYLLYPRQINFRQLGYSIYFMLISSLLCLITTGLVAFSTRNVHQLA